MHSGANEVLECSLACRKSKPYKSRHCLVPRYSAVDPNYRGMSMLVLAGAKGG